MYCPGHTCRGLPRPRASSVFCLSLNDGCQVSRTPIQALPLCSKWKGTSQGSVFPAQAPTFQVPVGLPWPCPTLLRAPHHLSCPENTQALPGPLGVACRASPSAPADTQVLGTLQASQAGAPLFLPGLFSRLGPRENVKCKDSPPPSRVCPGVRCLCPSHPGSPPLYSSPSSSQVFPVQQCVLPPGDCTCSHGRRALVP